VSRFRAVEELRTDYAVKRPCQVLEVSTSVYYAWRQRRRVRRDRAPTCRPGQRTALAATKMLPQPSAQVRRRQVRQLAPERSVTCSSPPVSSSCAAR
jgi:hypothetical protein